MFRKSIIALGAIAVVGAAALSPTAASAKGWKHHHWHGHHGHHGWYGGYGFFAPLLYAAPDCYVVRRVVFTKYGKRIRRVEVCD